MACATLAASGCVQNDIDLTVDRFLAPDPTSCTVMTTSTVGLASGLLDVGLMVDGGFSGYIAYPLISNNLPEVVASGGAELNAINVTGLNIQLSGGNTTFSQPSFFLAAAGGRVPPAGLVTFGAEILPRSVGLELAKSVPETTADTVFPVVNVAVSAVGTRSGTTIVSAPLVFPVEICKHCLSPAPGACPPAGFPAASIHAGSCNADQDATVTCCDSASSLLCGASVPVNNSTGAGDML